QTVPNAGTSRLMQFGILLLVLAAHLTTQAQNDFEWRDGSGETRNLSDLKEILQKHRQWFESGGKSGIQADLKGANLNGANLNGAFLPSASLVSADLTHADLNGADLNGAFLRDADLSGAFLRGAKLSDASLFGARLGRADFEPMSLPELRG